MITAHKKCTYHQPLGRVLLGLLFTLFHINLCVASKMPIQKHLLLVELGPPHSVKYCLESLYQKGHRVTLLTSIPSSWAAPYVEKIVYVDHYADMQCIGNTVKALHCQDPFDGILTWHEGVTSVVNHLQNLVQLPAISTSVCAPLRNKYAMRLAWERAGIRNPTFKLVKSKEDMATLDFFPSITKPVESMASIGAYKLNDKDDVPKAQEVSFHSDWVFHVEGKNYSLMQQYGLCNQVIAESYIPGREFSVEGFIQNGVVQFFGITQKKLGQEPFFNEIGHIFPAEITAETKESILNTVQKAVLALELHNSIFHAEVRVNEQGVYPLEIAARMGGDLIGSLVSRSLAIDIIDILVNIAIGNPIEVLHVVPPKTIGIVFQSLPITGYGKKIKNYQWKKNPKGIKTIEKIAYLERNDVYTTPERTGDTRIGHFMFEVSHPRKIELVFQALRNNLVLDYVT